MSKISRNKKELRWESETLYFNGDAYFDTALEAISSAKTRVWIEMYSIDESPLAFRLFDALEDAVHRGLEVRLIFDAIGSLNWAGTLEFELLARGIRYHIYHPILLLRRVNSRNHRKVILIDDDKLFTGSRNWVAEHSEAASGKEVWCDVSVALESVEEVKRIEKEFLWIWGDHKRRPYRGHLSRSNLFRAWRRKNIRDFYLNILKAGAELTLVTPYFVPTVFFLTLLRFAARHGTEVRIVLPRVSDVPVVRWVSQSYYRRLLKYGVRIYEYQASILHAKIAFSSNWIEMGSTNLNYRSFFKDLELDVRLTSPESRKQLEIWFKKTILPNSREIKMTEVSAQPYWQKVIGFLLRRLRFWM